jgi:redox-sensitive bicupin YhaK (pirin superfamily)
LYAYGLIDIIILREQMIISNGQELVIRDCFKAQSFNIEMFSGRIDPLIMIDHFRMTGPTFPVHPHAGISAVTYVFPGSSEAHMNYDSLHEPIAIEPGDIHWFAACSGAVHTELPRVEGREVHALQIFVNLPISMKRQKPYASHVIASHIPIYSDQDGSVRVVAGGYRGLASPLKTPTPFTLLDCHGVEGANQTVSMMPNWNYFLYSVGGSIEASLPGVSMDRAAVTLGPGQSLGFAGWDTSKDGIPLVINSAESSHFVLLGGLSLREPYCLGGPIVMESAEANQERLKAYRNGEFGQVKGF